VSDLQSPARLASVVYAPPPARDDPAELYQEASKLSRATARREVAGAVRLASAPALRRVAAHASSRHAELPLVPLAEPEPLSASLGETLLRRRSARALAPAPLRTTQLAALLEAAYGVTGSIEDEDGWSQPLRAAPSGGALYPLDLYLEIRRVDGLAEGLYRYEPLERGLERIGPPRRPLAETIAYPELAERAAVIVVVAATFWRARFKYGLRAYRFTLFEAGHVAQNVLLAATALGLAAVPLGGFYDRQLDDALALDGVDRSSLYVICVGRPETTC
jgi:SagB-type dehydrogenase family enzyme